jgi:hypothetical protein
MALRSLAAAAALFAGAALAKTDIQGCTYFDDVYTPPHGYPYATRTWYVPDTGEICELLECGGGRAPPKTTLPGCPAYEGTETYSPRFLDVATVGGDAPQTSTADEAVETTSAPEEEDGDDEASETTTAAEESEPTVSESSSVPVETSAPITTTTPEPSTTAAPQSSSTPNSNDDETSSTSTDGDDESTSTPGSNEPEPTGAASVLMGSSFAAAAAALLALI